jgi:6-phosphofructokinase 1
MFQEEGGKLFDSRAAMLGHTLQGGVPSPTDRARAVRLSLKCMAFIERAHAEICALPKQERAAHRASAAVITIQGTSVQWVPVQEMVEHADMANRRGKTAWWAGMKGLAEALCARPQLIGDK